MFILRLSLLLALVPFVASRAQTITIPDASQKASVHQTLGVTDIVITYHSPAVKGRRIWGGLVPFDGGTPMPWRAGANENTTFSTTHDLMVEGQRLPAGTYGVHMIPTENMWTVIFNRDHSSWGSFFYRKDQDALRVEVKPKPAAHEEWLRYGFEDLEPFAATVFLRWETLKVPIRIQVADGHAAVIANLHEQLRGIPGFFPQGHVAAARYCANNKVSYDDGLAWADRAIALGGGFNARMVKADLLELTGKAAEASEMRHAAMESASEADINNRGYELLNAGRTKDAIEIFSLNVKRFPDSWNVYDSLGEGYDRDGSTADAITYYRKALEKKPPADQVERISSILKNLTKK
jgi:hypothetical protein